MNKGDALPTVEKHITQEQIEKYAKASGDFNPIHIDADFAKTSHFGGTVAHGMMIAASVSEMMTLAFKENWLNTGRLKIRFRSPVYPDDTITTSGQVKKVEQRDTGDEITCAVSVRRQNGETAITGDAVVTLPSED